MSIYDSYMDVMNELKSMAAALNLHVSLEDANYPLKVVFKGEYSNQVGLYDNERKAYKDYMIVTVGPERSIVDVNLFAITNKDLSKIIKQAEKAVAYYLHAYREQEGIINDSAAV